MPPREADPLLWMDVHLSPALRLDSVHFASCSAAVPSQAQWLPLCPERMGMGACVGKLNVHLSHSCSSITFPLGSARGPWGQQLYLFVFPVSLASFSILEVIVPLT